MASRSAYWLYFTLSLISNWLIKGAILVTFGLTVYWQGIPRDHLLALTGISCLGSFLLMISHGLLFMYTQNDMPGIQSPFDRHGIDDL